MVAGASINVRDVEVVVDAAALIIAHNAAFDRRFLERFSSVFAAKPWACSMVEMDWRAEGYEGVKLSYLASQAGFFYDCHRATEDCLAGIELLARPLDKGGRTALFHLLEKARTSSWRIWAEAAPFEFKDRLKARGYRWNPGDGGTPRAWYIDRAKPDLEAELNFLREEIYGGDVDPLVRRIDAFDRYSDRC
ncbi:DNA polymerase III subunit epsilon [compost metagenome]